MKDVYSSHIQPIALENSSGGLLTVLTLETLTCSTPCIGTGSMKAPSILLMRPALSLHFTSFRSLRDVIYKELRRELPIEHVLRRRRDTHSRRLSARATQSSTMTRDSSEQLMSVAPMYVMLLHSTGSCNVTPAVRSTQC